MNLVLHLLASYGICFGLMNDKFPLVPKLRSIPFLPDEEGNTFFKRLLDCPYCTGFHAGWALWALSVFPIRPVEPCWALILLEAFTYAFASSAFCYISDTLMIMFEENTPQR